MPTFCETIESPLGLIEIEAGESAVTAVRFVALRSDAPRTNAVARRAARQLKEYFAGQRREFQLQLAPLGTEFQKSVWSQLLRVPFGTTASYRDIAAAIGNPKATRAVGAANGRNPIAIVVPCHRIIGSNGHLTGYGSGLWRKEWLLLHEGADLTEQIVAKK
jgi:methylated-DNA-[protein]-cysteine S-methyltransferase